MVAGKSDLVGRYMVAARDICPGEVVFTDQPAVVGPDNSAIPMCLVSRLALQPVAVTACRFATRS